MKAANIKQEQHKPNDYPSTPALGQSCALSQETKKWTLSAHVQLATAAED